MHNPCIPHIDVSNLPYRITSKSVMSSDIRNLVHFAKVGSCPSCNRETSNNALDVAATAVAVARVRGARATRVVAVTGAVDLALNDNAVAAVAVVSGNEKSEKAGDEEEDAVPG